MASQGYYDWLDAGEPYALIRPAAKTQAKIRSHGITVYDYPDESHLKASKPEDHTPFSVTGWPGANARWNARGLDIMPRDDSEKAQHENCAIAIQIIDDKDNGYPPAQWVKYINYTDENGDCWHVSWQPHKVITSSSDRGHVHVSGRSDVDGDTRADDYDPVARMNGDDMELTSPISETNTPNATNGRNVDQCIGDLEKDRLVKYGEIKPGDKRYPPTNTPAYAELQLPKKVDDLAAAVASVNTKMDQILAALAGQSGSVDQATVVAALKSPEGQAAIVDAVNYAEDH